MSVLQDHDFHIVSLNLTVVHYLPCQEFSYSTSTNLRLMRQNRHQVVAVAFPLRVMNLNYSSVLNLMKIDLN